MEYRVDEEQINYKRRKRTVFVETLLSHKKSWKYYYDFDEYTDSNTVYFDDYENAKKYFDSIEVNYYFGDTKNTLYCDLITLYKNDEPIESKEFELEDVLKNEDDEESEEE